MFFTITQALHRMFHLIGITKMRLKKGQDIWVMQFGSPYKMKIIEFDKASKTYKCGYYDAYGSCYYSKSTIELHKIRCNEYFAELNNKLTLKT